MKILKKASNFSPFAIDISSDAETNGIKDFKKNSQNNE